MDEPTKLPKSELRRHFDMCIHDTIGLNEDSLIGFIVGFRMYERMALRLGKQITEKESRSFVPLPKLDCSKDDNHE